MSVTYALDGSVAIITLDDGKANAIGHDLLAEIHEALDRAEAESTAVLLTGREGKLSAGFDLSVMTSGDEPMRALVVAGARLLARLFMHPAPVVIASNGHALAAGALLLLVADERIGADGPFKVGLNEVAIGMALPKFAIDLARYRMPPSQLDSALLGEVFAPARAVQAGYLDRVVPADELLTVAMARAQQLSQLRAGAVRLTKEIARGPIAADILATIEVEMAKVSAPPPR